MRDGKSCANYVVPSLFLQDFVLDAFNQVASALARRCELTSKRFKSFSSLLTQESGLLFSYVVSAFRLPWNGKTNGSLLPVQFTAEQI